MTRLEGGIILLSFEQGRTSFGDSGGLTPSERAVALLAAAGLSNAAIAGRRGRSTRTVANQIAAACAKLGVAGRRELRASFGGVE